MAHALYLVAMGQLLRLQLVCPARGFLLNAIKAVLKTEEGADRETDTHTKRDREREKTYNIGHQSERISGFSSGQLKPT